MPDTGGPREVALYPYLDRDGNLLFEVIRYLKPTGEKVFRQRRPDGRRPAQLPAGTRGASVGLPLQNPNQPANRPRAVFSAGVPALA